MRCSFKAVRQQKKPLRNGTAGFWESAGETARAILVPRALRGLQVGGRSLAAALVGLDLEGNLLALDETAHAGALESGGMNEHVLAAVVRLNEAVALLVVLEFHGARRHGVVPYQVCWYARVNGRAELRVARF